MLNQNASVSVFSLLINSSFLQACKSQVIVYVMHNFEKNACSQNVTIFFCKRINTFLFPPALVGSMAIAKETSLFMVKGHSS